MAGKKGLLERRVSGAVEPNQKYTGDTSTNMEVVQPAVKEKKQFKNQSYPLKISKELAKSLKAIKVMEKVKFDYEGIEILVDNYVQNLSPEEKRRFSVLKENL